MAEDINDVEETLLLFRQLRALTALHMRMYKVQNELILLSDSLSNQLFMTTLTFLGVVLAFANIVLVVQNASVGLIEFSLGITAFIFLVFIVLYRSQTKGKKGFRLRFLQNEENRFRDGKNEYSTIKLTAQEIRHDIEQAVKANRVDKNRAEELMKRLSELLKWLDETETEMQKGMENVNSEMSRLKHNA